MNIDANRTYSMGELRILLEKQRKEKEEKNNIEAVAAAIKKTTLEDSDISDKNCIYLSVDLDNIINILNRKIMYRDNQLWCPDHGDKCIIKKSPKDSYFPVYTCSMQPSNSSPFGMGCGKIIKAGKRTPLFFYNFNSDIRKIITVVALLQFEQMTIAKISSFEKDISYQNCTTIKEALARARIHDVRTLQILQNQWNLFKRYCAYHKINHLLHLNKIIKENPFVKGRGGKRKKAETAQTVIFNPAREPDEKFNNTIKKLLSSPSTEQSQAQSDAKQIIDALPNPIIVKVDPVVEPSSCSDIFLSTNLKEAVIGLIKAIDGEYSDKRIKDAEEIDLYKEDALKYRRMMAALNAF